MRDEQKFYKCEQCGNLIGLINNAGVPLTCCDEKMKELIPNTTEAAVEKHIPVVTVEGNQVTVEIGSIAHPMTKEHYITFVYIQTKKGGQRKELNPGDEPKVTFMLTEDDELVSAYAYCNLHGLWKK